MREKTVTVLLHRSTVTFIFSSSLPPNQQVFGCRSKTAVFLYDVDNLHDMQTYNKPRGPFHISDN